jgi:hypothetical protein
MKNGFLTLSEALQLMRKTDSNGNPIPFSITFVTYDKTRNTGGKLNSIKKAYMSVTEIKRTEPAKRIPKVFQNHFSNATRNIKSANGDLVKIHIYLITRINNIPVI